MARPKTYEEVRVQTAVRLPPDLLKRVGIQANRRDLSVNWIITKAIELFLERLEETSDEDKSLNG